HGPSAEGGGGLDEVQRTNQPALGVAWIGPGNAQRRRPEECHFHRDRVEKWRSLALITTVARMENRPYQPADDADCGPPPIGRVDGARTGLGQETLSRRLGTDRCGGRGSGSCPPELGSGADGRHCQLRDGGIETPGPYC